MKKTISWLIFISFFCAGGLFLTAGFLYLYLSPKLPSVVELKEIEYQVPLRIYSRDLVLIGEFGEKRRIPVEFDQLPTDLVNAILSAEDDRFFEHSGVDLMGLARAALELVSTGSIQSGGSTITMQVARNFFLSAKQEFTRKFNEILLAFRIEDTLTKQEILSLYINKIYLGNRAYGFAAAAQVYYGKPLEQLNTAQLAMLAGLPKAPSAFNPVVNPQRAKTRRDWILRRMEKLDYIDATQLKEALAQVVTAEYHGANIQSDAPYVAEMARLKTINSFGLDAYNNGYRVITTIDAGLNEVAQQAVRNGLLAYDARHGYRLPENHIDDPEQWPIALEKISPSGNLLPAVVTAIEESSMSLLLEGGVTSTLDWPTEEKVRRYQSENSRSAPVEQPSELYQVGDIIRVTLNEEGAASLAQVPDVQGALVALDPHDGAIRALTGGFDYQLSHFNRATQADRQPGSNFKPFLYATALDNGFTAASMILDAPIVEDEWRPENDSGKFYGPTRLREALYRSRNLVSIRILRQLGLNKGIEGISRFGFHPDNLPRDLSLALGTHAVKPIDIARGYATFANGGYLIEPYLIEKIVDRRGNVLYQSKPAIACDAACKEEQERLREFNESISQSVDSPFADLKNVADELGEPEEEVELSDVVNASQYQPVKYAPQVLSSQTTFIMDSILKDVVQRGTATKAKVLERSDIGGKTGTTNGPKDAWFSGYSPHVVTTAWVGFDDNKDLGRNEYGGSAALPIWIDFMREALKGQPQRFLPQPDGIVQLRIDPRSSKRAAPGASGSVFEYFRIGTEPAPLPDDNLMSTTPSDDPVPDDIL